MGSPGRSGWWSAGGLTGSVVRLGRGRGRTTIYRVRLSAGPPRLVGNESRGGLGLRAWWTCYDVANVREPEGEDFRLGRMAAGGNGSPIAVPARLHDMQRTCNRPRLSIIPNRRFTNNRGRPAPSTRTDPGNPGNPGATGSILLLMLFGRPWSRPCPCVKSATGPSPRPGRLLSSWMMTAGSGRALRAPAATV